MTKIKTISISWESQGFPQVMDIHLKTLPSVFFVFGTMASLSTNFQF